MARQTWRNRNPRGITDRTGATLFPWRVFENHAPWCISHPAVEFGIDEIGHAAEKQPDRGHQRDQVTERNWVDFMLA